ncbi:cupin domain-containing protein [Methanolobus sp. WCC5]|jgi:mannose-6-phosphate isomerase-like protein (cupin superfamily)|uniref:cupin domain-containing protein n=1 Tax=Methanolobus sp. WCC5 TaxID=3125785 RepID=UPI00325206BD
MVIRTCNRDVEAYITKDGSSIRELIHPLVHGNTAQSLAEATVPAGSSTLLHIHNLSEEIYHVISGTGLLTLGDEDIIVQTGDSICIPPKTPHNIKNTGRCELRILCCCSPAYSHNDTQILE